MPTDFASILGRFFILIEKAIPVVASLALLAFFWGLAKFIYKSGDETAVEEGKDLMVWGVIAIFIMVSIWGILRYLSLDIGFGPLGIPFLPES